MCALDVFCALVQVNGSRSQSSLCFASMWTHCVEVLWGDGQAVGSGAAAARCAQSINATNILVPERPRDDDRREYDETDRVDPGIIRGPAVAPRVESRPAVTWDYAACVSTPVSVILSMGVASFRREILSRLADTSDRQSAVLF